MASEITYCDFMQCTVTKHMFHASFCMFTKSFGIFTVQIALKIYRKVVLKAQAVR